MKSHYMHPTLCVCPWQGDDGGAPGRTVSYESKACCQSSFTTALMDPIHHTTGTIAPYLFLLIPFPCRSVVY